MTSFDAIDIGKGVFSRWHGHSLGSEWTESGDGADWPGLQRKAFSAVTCGKRLLVGSRTNFWRQNAF